MDERMTVKVTFEVGMPTPDALERLTAFLEKQQPTWADQ